MRHPNPNLPGGRATTSPMTPVEWLDAVMGLLIGPAVVGIGAHQSFGQLAGWVAFLVAAAFGVAFNLGRYRRPGPRQ